MHQHVRASIDRIKEVVMRVLAQREFITGAEVRHLIRHNEEYDSLTNRDWRSNYAISDALKELITESLIKMVKTGRKFPYTLTMKGDRYLVELKYVLKGRREQQEEWFKEVIEEMKEMEPTAVVIIGEKDWKSHRIEIVHDIKDRDITLYNENCVMILRWDYDKI